MASIKSAALMTAGRYENTYCRSIIEQALRPLNIPLNVHIGVYYGQCMQRMFEDIVKTDCDFIVTVDGDSLITTDNVMRLLKLASEGLDAVVAIQARRGMQAIMGRAEAMVGGLVKAKTAHFGLTVISVAALRKVPKPWFCPVPDETGSWGENKVDEDIGFWLQWEKAGNQLFIDPQTRIGHLEEMATIVTDKGQVQHIYPQDWEIASQT